MWSSVRARPPTLHSLHCSLGSCWYGAAGHASTFSPLAQDGNCGGLRGLRTTTSTAAMTGTPARRQQQQQPSPLAGGSLPGGPLPMPTPSLVLSSLRRQVTVLCIESNGRIKELRMPVTQLRDESRLHMRELLILEQPSALVQARILPRRHCIVLTVGFIRAMVFTDRVYLFSPAAPHVPGYAQSLAQHVLQIFGPEGVAGASPSSSSSVGGGGRGGGGGGANFAGNGGGGSATPAGNGGGGGAGESDTAPFELVVMEHALLTLVMRQSKRVGYARRVLASILANMGTVERDDGRTLSLFPLSNTLTHYEIVSRGLCEAIRALLDDDRDMREACLTEKARISNQVVAAAQRTSRSTASAYDPLVDAPPQGGLTMGAAAGAGGDRHLSPSAAPLGGGGEEEALLQSASEAGGAAAAAISGNKRLATEGSAAFLGHAASPIGSYRHLGRAIRSDPSMPTSSGGGTFDADASPPAPVMSTMFSSPLAGGGGRGDFRADRGATIATPPPHLEGGGRGLSGDRGPHLEGGGRGLSGDRGPHLEGGGRGLSGDRGGQGRLRHGGSSSGDSDAYPLLPALHLGPNGAGDASSGPGGLPSASGGGASGAEFSGNAPGTTGGAPTYQSPTYEFPAETASASPPADADDDMYSSPQRHRAALDATSAMLESTDRLSADSRDGGLGGPAAPMSHHDSSGSGDGPGGPGDPWEEGGRGHASSRHDSGALDPGSSMGHLPHRLHRHHRSAAEDDEGGMEQGGSSVDVVEEEGAGASHWTRGDPTSRAHALLPRGLEPAGSGGGGNPWPGLRQEDSFSPASFRSGGGGGGGGGGMGSNTTFGGRLGEADVGNLYSRGSTLALSSSSGAASSSSPPQGQGAPAHLPTILRVSPDSLSQLELMMESVYHSAAETVVGLVELSRALRSKTELLELQQSNYRNFLLSLSLRMSVMGVSISTATFFTAAFGMNLRTGLEGASPLAFAGVTGAAVVAGMLFYRSFESLATRHSPTQTHARRLAAFQDFLFKLDSRVDAAKSTISQAAAAPSAAAAAAAQQQPLGGGGDAASGGSVSPLEVQDGGFLSRFPDFGLSSLSLEERASMEAATGPGGASLSKAQFKALHEKTTGRSISQDEVDLLFELLDADSDGKLRLEEALETFSSLAPAAGGRGGGGEGGGAGGMLQPPGGGVLGGGR